MSARSKKLLTTFGKYKGARSIVDMPAFFQGLAQMEDAINSILNAQIINTADSTGRITYADGNIAFLIAAASSGGATIRGEYTPTPSKPYKAGDIVVVRGDNVGGFPTGTYGCVKNSPGATNPPTQPDTGNTFWISLSNGNTLGQWT